MLQVRIIGKEEVIAHILGAPESVRSALVTMMYRLVLLVQRNVVEGHLSGPTGEHSLSVGTQPGEPHGKLRRSVQTSVTSGETLIAGKIFYTGDVPYAAIHEFGGVIHVPEIVPSKAQALHFMYAGKEIFARRVRAHDVHMPERAPLRTGFAEMFDQIQAGMREAVSEGWK